MENKFFNYIYEKSNLYIMFILFYTYIYLYLYILSYILTLYITIKHNAFEHKKKKKKKSLVLILEAVLFKFHKLILL